MRFIVDCSVTMSWCFADEGDPYSAAVLDAVSKSEAVVPSIWPLEVANALLVGERRHRLTEADSMRFLELLSNLSINIDASSPAEVLHSVLALGRQHRLSSYDAAYLELAMREGLPLATLDDTLRTAAKAAGIRLVDL